jgi:protein ImuB
MKRRILCLHLPDWPIQRLRAARETEIQNSEFRIQKQPSAQTSHSAFCILHSAFPIILHARDPRRGDVVVVCNAAAHRRGVRSSTPLAEAATLAQHAGECLILPHDRAADLAALARLAEHCERFSPIVGWKTVQSSRSKVQSQKTCSDLGCWTLDVGPKTGPDCLFLDVTGISVLFGGEEKLEQKVIDDVARLGYPGLGYQARVAIADTIGAAWAMAKCEGRCSALHTLALDCLRLPDEKLHLLAELGIERLDQLLALPRDSLRARFGELLLLRIDQLLGAAQEMIVPHRPPPQFSDEWVLEYPAERRDIIEQIARKLIQRIATALAARREGVLKLACRLDCAPGRPVILNLGLFRPSADPEHLWNLLQMQLEQAALPGAIGRVRLDAALTAPLENRQAELFAGSRHQAERQLALLIDRASSRLGPEAVLRPELTADPLPERAVRYRAGVGRAGVRSGSGAGGQSEYSVLRTQYLASSKQPRRKASQPLTHFDTALCASQTALLRPTMLFSPPAPLTVLSVAPNGPPVSFTWQGQAYQVAARDGPERIETGWWRGKSVRRDYWRIETTTGQRFWLFRELNTGQWCLHGEYA